MTTTAASPLRRSTLILLTAGAALGAATSKSGTTSASPAAYPHWVSDGTTATVRCATPRLVAI
ncbi:MAG: hypothetical protein ACKORK_01720, partial [Gemmatimonadota bacterium]